MSCRSPYAVPISRPQQEQQQQQQQQQPVFQNILLRNKLGESKASETRLRDLSFEFDRLKSHASHVESQNQVLELSLEDCKALNNQFSVVLSKRESNESVLTLSLHYCDAIIEAYDVLVALLETENAILQSSMKAMDVSGRVGEENSSIGSGSTKSQRARSQRRSGL